MRKRIEVPETVFTRVFYAASQAMQEAIGDSQPPWDELPAWQQHAMVDVTRRCMTGATPEQLHTLWVQHYSAHGWTYGPEKNWETKQHPIIIPWHELPLRYQARFKLWQAIVATLMLEIPEYSAVHSLIRSLKAAAAVPARRPSARVSDVNGVPQGRTAERRQPPSGPGPRPASRSADRG